MEEIPKINCYKIDIKHMFIKCCYCKKSHKHGSNNDFTYRTENRSAHCDESKTYDIIIDENTPKDEVSHYNKYKDKIKQCRDRKKSEWNDYIKKRYYSLYKEKMTENIIQRINNHPEILVEVTKHFGLKAINEN